MNATQAALDGTNLLQHKLRLNVGQHSVAGVKEHNEDAIGIRIPDGNLLATKGAVAAGQPLGEAGGATPTGDRVDDGEGGARHAAIVRLASTLASR